MWFPLKNKMHLCGLQIVSKVPKRFTLWKFQPLGRYEAVHPKRIKQNLLSGQNDVWTSVWIDVDKRLKIQSGFPDVKTTLRCRSHQLLQCVPKKGYHLMYCKLIEICSAKITQYELIWELKHSNSNVRTSAINIIHFKWWPFLGLTINTSALNQR